MKRLRVEQRDTAAERDILASSPSSSGVVWPLQVISQMQVTLLYPSILPTGGTEADGGFFFFPAMLWNHLMDRGTLVVVNRGFLSGTGKTTTSAGIGQVTRQTTNVFHGMAIFWRHQRAHSCPRQMTVVAQLVADSSIYTR